MGLAKGQFSHIQCKYPTADLLPRPGFGRSSLGLGTLAMACPNPAFAISEPLMIVSCTVPDWPKKKVRIGAGSHG